MDDKLIGRYSECYMLHKICSSYKSEFVAVYGRRRVGKTFMINQYFDNKYNFKVTGLGNSGSEEQLLNFHNALKRTNPKVKVKLADNWLDAFEQLRKAMGQKVAQQSLPVGRFLHPFLFQVYSQHPTHGPAQLD